MIDLKTATIEAFEACKNQVFSIDLGEFQIGLVLQNCELSKFGRSESDAEARHPFSLTFVGEDQPQLSQGSYALRNETLGEVAMFLVPIGMGKYEAIFN